MASAGSSQNVPTSHRRKRPAGIREPSELKEIRKSLTKENFPWMKRKLDSDITKSLHHTAMGIHLSLYSHLLYEEWKGKNRPVAPLKLVQIDDFTASHNANQVIALLEKKGWTHMWLRLDMTSYSKNLTRKFYANMWITPASENSSFFLNTVINGTPLSFSIQEICTILGVRNEGLSDFSVFDWSDRYGISEQDVKFHLQYFPTKKTQNMPLVNRILLAVVTYCVNGKATRNPSNMDFYVTYRILQETQLNFGWILVEVMMAALRKGSKALPFANIVTMLIKSKGIEISDESLTDVANTDYYDNSNIAQAVDSQRRKSTLVPDLADEVDEGPQDGDGSSTNAELIARIQSLEQSVQHLQLRDARHEYRFGVLKDAILHQMPWASFPPDFDDLGGDTAAAATAGDTGIGVGGVGGVEHAGGSGQQMGGFAEYASSRFSFGDLQHPGGSGAGSGGGM